MKIKLLIGIILVTLMVPSYSHGFGLMRYVFDLLSNQLGLDRGPIPKVAPKIGPSGPLGGCDPTLKHYSKHKLYIQAEGF
jgi:hypothetical protein